MNEHERKIIKDGLISARESVFYDYLNSEKNPDEYAMRDHAVTLMRCGLCHIDDGNYVFTPSSGYVLHIEKEDELEFTQMLLAEYIKFKSSIMIHYGVDDIMDEFKMMQKKEYNM